MEHPSLNSPFAACKQIILKPNPVFATLKNTPNWSWVPFFIVVLFSTLPVYLYYSMIDFDWYVNSIIELQHADKSPAEIDFFRNQMQREQALSLTLISTPLGLVLTNAIHAFYLYKMTRIDSENLMSYGDWYGFTWWVSLPVVLTSFIALCVLLMFGHEQMYISEINPTSIAYLFGIGMESDWFGLAQSFRLETIWSLYLIAVGISQWTRLSSQKCYIIAAAPFVIIWAVWTGFVVFS